MAKSRSMSRMSCFRNPCPFLTADVHTSAVDAHLAVIAALILPLALDTFVLAAALGVAGVPVERRRRISLVLAGFEAGMPVVGLLGGRIVGRVIGAFAGWIAIAVLIGVGVMMLRPGDEAGEERRMRLLAHARGIALLDLGFAISVDELAVGLTIGLLGGSILAAVVWIGVQAFVAAEAGMRIGSKVGEEFREHAERFAGAVLLALGLGLLVVRLVHGTG